MVILLIFTKEKEEQSIVTNYILDCFAQNNLTPKTNHRKINNGQLEHLYTEITAKATIGQQEAIQLMNDLAPTPAVGGLPMLESTLWLSRHEKMPRQWYSGIIGVLGPKKIRTYVNLRCGLLYKNQALLYAGAGITAGSDPEKEYQETEAKMKNLGNFLV